MKKNPEGFSFVYTILNYTARNSTKLHWTGLHLTALNFTRHYCTELDLY